MRERGSVVVVVLLLLGASACSSSRSGGSDDAGVRLDAGPLPDAGSPADVGPARDAGSDPDAGPRDGGPSADAGSRLDAGAPTCAADSCAADRACGRSFCGAPCGECAVGSFCTPTGTCVAGAPPGTFCVDAFGENVIEGARSFRVCPVDSMLYQSCVCSGGGRDAWVSCGDCQDIVLAGERGDRCDDARQCGGGPCHPAFGLCGESCEAGRDTCPAGTVCGIPGDVSGVCLTPCDACGAPCGASGTCRPADDGLVCVPTGFGWARSC